VSLSLYHSATSEARLSVRLFEAAPDALGALVEGVRDSTTLSHLVVGLEPFRGMPSDMVGGWVYLPGQLHILCPACIMAPAVV
jgi:hypothetical protein